MRDDRKCSLCEGESGKNLMKWKSKVLELERAMTKKKEIIAEKAEELLSEQDSKLELNKQLEHIQDELSLTRKENEHLKQICKEKDQDLAKRKKDALYNINSLTASKNETSKEVQRLTEEVKYHSAEISTLHKRNEELTEQKLNHLRTIREQMNHSENMKQELHEGKAKISILETELQNYSQLQQVQIDWREKFEKSSEM